MDIGKGCSRPNPRPFKKDSIKRIIFSPASPCFLNWFLPRKAKMLSCIILTFRSRIELPVIESPDKFLEISKELKRLIEQYSAIDSDCSGFDFDSLRNLLNTS